MTNHENENPGESPDSVSDLLSSLEFDTPDIAEQRQWLDAIMDRFTKEWNESGILKDAFFDQLPDFSVLQQPDYTVRLHSIRSVIENYPGMENQELRLALLHTKDGVTSNEATVSLVQRQIDSISGKGVGKLFYDTERIDETQANLLNNQADELARLKRDGILPNLQEGANTIFDRSTAIMMRPDPNRDSYGNGYET